MINPYLITEPTVISFSGGRTSAFMLWKVLEAHGGVLPSDAIVCFANTGKEEEALFIHVRDVAQKIIKRNILKTSIVLGVAIMKQRII